MCARLVGHFKGLTWRDVQSLELRDFRALVDQMNDDLEAQEREYNKSSRGGRGRSAGGNGERRTPVMT
ncbi:tail assembly chaperone [Streptomyces phage RemusLoopin]|uniref:Tail assembly chaperone n=1 Tax=Streptomyces phage RemusLoopin TaxID=2562346 RepID=A0A4D6E5G1_9CAUD|nr:tail assembly chaperone [Streptomyces phage RemusLoopin]